MILYHRAHKAYWKTYDEKLLDLPFLKKTNIYRCGIRQLQKYYYLRYKKNYKHHPYFYMLAIRFLLYLDIFSAWFFECRHHALEIINKEKIDCVLTTSPPHSIHLFGRFLKKKAGIPWIMDIRDAIYDDPNRPATLVTKMQAPIRLWYEKRFFSSSDAIVAVSDVIKDGKNGYLIEQKKSLDLAKKIVKLAGDEKLRKQMGDTGRMIVEQCFNWNHQAKRVIQIYDSLLT